MAETASDRFTLSEALARQIAEAQFQQAYRKRRRFFVFTDRIDVTPTEAPSSADEPLSLSRAKDSIESRFAQYVAALAHRAREAGRKSLALATPEGLVERAGNAFAHDLGFKKPTDHHAWSAAFAEELRAWLSVLPDKKYTRRWYTLTVLDDNSIVLLPHEQP